MMMSIVITHRSMYSTVIHKHKITIFYIIVFGVMSEVTMTMSE